MIGLPSDMILFGTLMHLLCNELKLNPRNLVFHLGSAHIYAAHRERAWVYLSRPRQADTPHLDSAGMWVDNFDPEGLELYNYSPQIPLKFELFK